MTVLILEDEERTANYLEDLIHQYDAGIRVAAKIPSVQKAAQWLANNDAPDLILSDIHLEDALVFQLFDSVSIPQPVIFTTAFDEYVVRAFKVNSIDYLLKPVQLGELAAAMDKYKAVRNHFTQHNFAQLVALLDNRSPTSAYKQRFMITAGNKIFTVPTHDAAYFMLESKVTHVVTSQGQKLVVNYTLEELCDVLDPALFFRVNRQFIVSHASVVNAQVSGAGKITLSLRPAAREPVVVSGDRIAAFKTWLGK